VDAIRSIHGRRMGLSGPRTWPVRALPNWLVAFIATVVLGDAVLIAVTASVVTIHAHDLEVFAGLLVCSAATVELTRRVGENTSLVKDVHASWELPVAMLLPQTRAVDAIRIAERIRSNIAALSIIAPGATGGERVQVTVSIGVAALDSGGRRDLAELMAAADAALYRAKAGGRDQVQMISTSRGLSASAS
jgi:Diguanylate cyclase, GGDEF domain